jgi:ankyrin repeat protein
MRRTALSVLFSAVFASAIAQESAGEPSALACTDFRLETARVLPGQPDSLQINNLLFEAARKGCVNSLDELFKASASRLARDRMGNTPLAVAARAGRLAVVKALLASASPDETVQIDRVNVAGSTPLIQAVQSSRTEVARQLVDAGARVDVANAQGETALSAAAFNADVELATLLLAHEAQPNTTDATGKSVIVYAAARGAAPIVEMLLDAGVDVNARYRADLTALMWAAGHSGNTAADAALRTVKLLLSHGAKVDLVDDRGRSALMIATGLSHAAIAQALVDAGADRTIRDKSGKSAADLAAAPEIKAIVAGPQLPPRPPAL